VVQAGFGTSSNVAEDACERETVLRGVPGQTLRGGSQFLLEFVVAVMRVDGHVPVCGW
jgi:hypothetical protein